MGNNDPYSDNTQITARAARLKRLRPIRPSGIAASTTARNGDEDDDSTRIDDADRHAALKCRA